MSMTDNPIEEIYGGSSNFLKTTDLDKGVIKEVTIKGVAVQNVGDQNKIVLELDMDKSFVLNKTNATQLAGNFDELQYEKWVGKKFKLFRTVTQYQGGTVECIRVV